MAAGNFTRPNYQPIIERLTIASTVLQPNVDHLTKIGQDLTTKNIQHITHYYTQVLMRPPRINQAPYSFHLGASRITFVGLPGTAALFKKMLYSDISHDNPALSFLDNVQRFQQTLASGGYIGTPCFRLNEYTGQNFLLAKEHLLPMAEQLEAVLVICYTDTAALQNISQAWKMSPISLPPTQYNWDTATKVLVKIDTEDTVTPFTPDIPILQDLLAYRGIDHFTQVVLGKQESLAAFKTLLLLLAQKYCLPIKPRQIVSPNFKPLIENLTVVCTLDNQIRDSDSKISQDIREKNGQTIIQYYGKMLESSYIKQAPTKLDLEQDLITFVGLPGTTLLFRKALYGGTPFDSTQFSLRGLDNSQPLYRKLATPFCSGTPCFRLMEYKDRNFDTFSDIFQPIGKQHTQQETIVVIAYSDKIVCQEPHTHNTTPLQQILEAWKNPEICFPPPGYQWHTAVKVLVKIDTENMTTTLNANDIPVLQELLRISNTNCFTHVVLNDLTSLAAFRTLLLLLTYTYGYKARNNSGMSSVIASSGYGQPSGHYPSSGSSAIPTILHNQLGTVESTNGITASLPTLQQQQSQTIAYSVNYKIMCIEHLTIATILKNPSRTIKNQGAIETKSTGDIIASYRTILSPRTQAATLVNLSNCRITFVGLTGSASIFRTLMGIQQRKPEQARDTTNPLYQKIVTPLIIGTPCFRIMECKKSTVEPYRITYRQASDDFVILSTTNHSQQDTVLIMGYSIGNEGDFSEIEQIFQAVTEEIIPPKTSKSQLQSLYQWQNTKKILVRIDREKTASMQTTQTETLHIKQLMTFYQIDYFTRINLDNPESIAAFHTLLLLLSHEDALRN
jgi:hypothetical protein